MSIAKEILVNAYEYVPRNEVMEFEQMVAAAEYTASINLVSESGRKIYDKICFQILIAGITTNVVVRVQGSMDGENWANASLIEADTTYTANGTNLLYYKGDGQFTYIRLYWVSESGGTAATIDVKAKFFDLDEETDEPN